MLRQTSGGALEPRLTLAVVALPHDLVMGRNSRAGSRHIYPLPFEFPSQSIDHSALGRVPCAIQYVLIHYVFYT